MKKSKSDKKLYIIGAITNIKGSVAFEVKKGAKAVSFELSLYEFQDGFKDIIKQAKKELK